MNRLLIFLATLLVFSKTLLADPFTILHQFDMRNSGQPTAPLTLVGSELFGGTAYSPSNGSIYALNLDGSNYHPTHYFPLFGPMALPSSLKLVGSKLYSTTFWGGDYANTGADGTIFSINPDYYGTEFTVHHSFGGSGDGGGPAVGPLVDGEILYGSTQSPPALYSYNVASGAYAVLHRFRNSAPADVPIGEEVLIGSKLFGITNLGAVYSVNTDGTGFSDIRQLNGTFFPGGLATNTSKLFGLTKNTLFSMNIDGSDYATLYNFPTASGGPALGRDPVGELLVVGSTIYGYTNAGGSSNQGVIYSIGIDGADYRQLHDFSISRLEGNHPLGRLLLVNDTLYGVTMFGGADSAGTIWSLQIPEPSGILPALIAALVASRRKKSGQR